MGRPKSKDAKATSFSLDVEILKRLQEKAKQLEVPKTRIVERAIVEYFDRLEQKTSKISVLIFIKWHH